MYDYLSNRYHSVKIGNIFSDWLCAKLGVPQIFVMILEVPYLYKRHIFVHKRGYVTLLTTTLFIQVLVVKMKFHLFYE